jgi:hypothetical protein
MCSGHISSRLFRGLGTKLPLGDGRTELWWMPSADIGYSLLFHDRWIGLPASERF